MSQTPSVVEKISSWLREVKAGEALSEPGGYQGATTHPSKSIDDNLQETTTGSRASENSADTKETVPLSIEKTPEATPGSGPNQDTGQINIGPQQSATGEAPAVEDDFKGKKEDPGTSHPAKADDGEKYASLSLEALEQELTKQSNALLAAIVSEPAAPVAPAVKTANEVTNPAVAAAVSEQEKAAAAGYATAAALGANGLAALDPSLREGIVDYTAAIIKTACEDADRVIAFLHARHEALQKQAEDEEDDDDDDDGGKKPESEGKGGEGGEGGGSKPESGPPAGGGGAPSGPPAAVPGVDAGLMAAMSGGGAPASPAAPGPGDGSIGGPMGGGDPMMGGGAPPMGGAPGGAPGMGGADPAMVQELLSAMNEMGITVEDLMAAQQAEGPKLASLAAAYRRSGQYKFEATKTAAQRAQRDQMRNYLRELCPNK